MATGEVSLRTCEEEGEDWGCLEAIFNLVEIGEQDPKMSSDSERDLVGFFLALRVITFL